MYISGSYSLDTFEYALLWPVSNKRPGCHLANA